jgi:hypothetical protein
MGALLFLLIWVKLMAPNFMGIDEIKPGMKGYGLTVFKGTKVDTFHVEIIDVMKKVVPKGDVILAKISSGIVDTAGVIAGMSGSPIYINDRLIGALAYNFSVFPKKPFAGITPINEIINPPSLGCISQSSKFCYLKLPIYCPGLSDQILQEMEKGLPGLEIIQTKGSGEVMGDSVIPSPGSSLGLLLVDGDLVWHIMGTCTYSEGDKIWGFGHPILALGKTDFPMTGGHVYSVIPSSFLSYKMCAPTKIIGVIKSDNARGIIGKIGEIPQLIRFNLDIQRETFSYRIVKEKILLPFLFRGLLFYSIFTALKGGGDVTGEIVLKIKGTKDFHFTNLFTGSPQKIAQSIDKMFTLIQNNPFQKVEMEEIYVKLDAQDTIRMAKIEGLEVDKKKVLPNDTLHLSISLFVYQKEHIREHILIKIPEWINKGELLVKVESGRSVRNRLKSQIYTLEDLAQWVNESPRDNEIVITFTQKGESGKMLGRKFYALPPSVALFAQKEKGENKVFEQRIPTKWVIIGQKTIKLEVK